MTIRELKTLVDEIVPYDYLDVHGPDAALVTDETSITFDCSLTIAEMRRIVVAADHGPRRVVDAQFGDDTKNFKAVAVREVSALFEDGFPKIEMTTTPEYEKRRDNGPLEHPTLYLKGRRIAFHAYGPSLVEST